MPPGTGIVIAVLALAAAWTVWSWPHRTVRPGHRDDVPRLDMRVRVNSAPPAELVLLPGIGATLAARIERDRRVRGPFGALDDLRRVDGIGPGLVRRIEPFATTEGTVETSKRRDVETAGADDGQRSAATVEQ